MFTTYVLANHQEKRYTGSTSNISQRLSMHNNTDSLKAKFHKTTYKKGPWKIIFFKDFLTRKEALIFERFLKTGIGRDWLNNTLKSKMISSDG